MDEKEKEQIKEEAKKLLEKFSKALENAKIKGEESNVERVEDRRKEQEGEKGGKENDNDFRKIMFENFRIKDSESHREFENSRDAPSKNEDFIIAEKKTW